MNNEKRTLPEGYYNPQYHTYLHYTETDFMDCNPKSYKYILQIEKEIDRLTNNWNNLEKFIDDELTKYEEREESTRQYQVEIDLLDRISDKLKELKDSDK